MSDIVLVIVWLGRSSDTGEVAVVETSPPIPDTSLEEVRALAEERIQAGGAITGYQISGPDGEVVAERLPPEALR
jgi:hypothetical protein